MPTETFFRLAEEKRERITAAAWEEFTHVRFMDASINRIIRGARIPRGSFYQYFVDKNDLFRYLLEGMRTYFLDNIQEIIARAGGDPFRFPVFAFDQFALKDGDRDLFLNRFIHVLQINPGLDLQNMFTDRLDRLPPALVERLDLSGFRSREEGFVKNVFFLIVAPLAYAIMETLRNPEQWERQREILQTRVEIIRYGSVAPLAVARHLKEEEMVC